MVRYKIRYSFTDYNYSKKNYKEAILKFELPCFIDYTSIEPQVIEFLRLLIAQTGYNPDTVKIIYCWEG